VDASRNAANACLKYALFFARSKTIHQKSKFQFQWTGIWLLEQAATAAHHLSDHDSLEVPARSRELQSHRDCYQRA
jgi:hypothetical protein